MERVLYFDGICNLCNRLVIFVIRRDRMGIIKFASLQSDNGKKIQATLTIPDADSIIYVIDGRKFIKSNAILRVFKDLGGGWKILGIAFLIFPVRFRDLIYDFIAKHRYRIFGKRDNCMVPTEDIRQRFLTD